MDHPVTQRRADPEEDVAAVQRTIAHHELAVTDLQTEIEELMRNVRKIRFQIIKHQEEITFQRGKITLARRLPPEILASIFESCSLDGWTRAPLTASHVCSEWRRAAQIPTVWSQVYVDVDSVDAYGRTRFWLEKSGTAKIDIAFDVRNYAGSIPELMGLLLLHRMRWRSLALSSLQIVHANEILQECTELFPSLRTLRISVNEEFESLGNGEFEGDAALRSLRNSFQNCPELHTFIINRNIPPFAGEIPSNITNLSINLFAVHRAISLSTTALLELFPNLPSLENLSISLVDGHETTFLPIRDTERPFITLHRLKSLRLTGHSNLYSILRHIYCPALSHLHLICSVDPIPVSHQWTGLTLLQWIDLGNTSLELLELRDVDIAQEVFIACFASLAKLKTLKLHDSEISDIVFESLNGPRGHCPNLTSVDLRWCGQVTGQALVRFVQSRLSVSVVPGSSAAPIASVTVITVINCSFVEEQNILDLARDTICRLVVDTNDHCRE